MIKNNTLHTVVKWLGRILLAVLSLLGLIVLYLFIQESIIRNKVHAAYPAPGEMVDLGTHQLHLNCTGSGSPTIVFESDLDQYGSLSWLPVQEEISKHTRACSYDRAGILWSEAGPRPRDGITIATELNALLEEAGEKGPYLLVGHALGGSYLRIFAGQYPGKVSGMVLVESSHPEMLTRSEELGLEVVLPEKSIRPLIVLLSHLGQPGRSISDIPSLTRDIKDPVESFLPESSMAWYDEMVEAPITLGQDAEVSHLNNIPLFVLATSRPPSIIEGGSAIHGMWLELQQDLLNLSENSELRIYEIGHYPQLQESDLVIGAILDMLGK